MLTLQSILLAAVLSVSFASSQAVNSTPLAAEGCNCKCCDTCKNGGCADCKCKCGSSCCTGGKNCCGTK